VKQYDLYRGMTVEDRRYGKAQTRRARRRGEALDIAERLEALRGLRSRTYTMVRRPEDEILPGPQPIETGPELVSISREIVDLLAEEAPIVNARREEPNVWADGLWDEVDEQDWMTSLLLTDPRTLAPAVDRWRATNPDDLS